MVLRTTLLYCNDVSSETCNMYVPCGTGKYVRYHDICIDADENETIQMCTYGTYV